MENAGGGANDNKLGKSASSIELDIVALATSILVLGDKPLRSIKMPDTSRFWIRYKDDSRIRNRRYESVVTWRRRVTYSLRAGSRLEVLEMDEWGRLKAMFPKEVQARLAWNASQRCDPLPVARFFDPDGNAEMLLIHSRCQSHAVDVLHNLTSGGPVVQPLWIADIMRLHPLLGIKLVRDEDYSSTKPISGYFSAWKRK